MHPVCLKTLSQLIPGQKGSVRSVSAADPALHQKLLTMGIVPGSTVEVSRRAPLGDPIAVRTTGHLLSIRLSEAETIQVDPL